MQKVKKITGILTALMLCGSAVALSGCSGYKPTALDGDISGTVGSNGGFVVEKGNYVYFINGQEESNANNTYGEVVKGGLYRIAKADLKSGNYDKAQSVVPALFVSQNFNSGIYIYGDYVYFASPATEKERDGTVASSYLNFKRAKLDGSTTEKELNEYIFRVSDNSVEYRYVQENDVVYCLYVQNGALHSVNTETKVDTVLASGASSYCFDTENLENPIVYYTMGVTTGADSENAITADYNQIYAVHANATVTVDKATTSYTVGGYRTYSFDGGYLKDNSTNFDANDYTTYPYVNLGTLFLDGRGASDTACPKTVFNDTEDKNTDAVYGYTYTLQEHLNGEIFFTRAKVNKTTSDGDTAELYVVADDSHQAEGWNAIVKNTTLEKVADNNTNASQDAVFYMNGTERGYVYLNGTRIVRKAVSTGEETVLVPDASGVTLMKTEGDYLYYSASATQGKNLYRVKWNGDKSKYDPMNGDDEYKATKILNVQFNDSWYAPEFAENVLLYSNAQSYGSVAFNYIFAVNLNNASGEMMNTAELTAFNDKYKEITDFIDECSSDSTDLSGVIEYYFRTGETKAYDEFIAEAKAQGYKDHYRFDKPSMDTIKEFTTHTGSYADKYKDENGTYYTNQNYFMAQVGATNADDAEEIETIWRTSYVKPLPSDEETDDNGMTTSQIVWTIVGSVAGVAVVTVVIVWFVTAKKKKAKLIADREATAVRKPKLDTTDDKSIDVYHMNDETESTEESVENTSDTTETVEITETEEIAEGSELAEQSTENDETQQKDE